MIKVFLDNGNMKETIIKQGEKIIAWERMDQDLLLLQYCQGLFNEI
jgi:hypothetical protein